MRNTPSLSPRLHFPLHSRRLNRYCLSQFVPRYCSSRHILRSSTFPLCPFYRSRICHRRSLCSLIPAVHRLHPSQHLNKNPLWNHVHRSKPYLLPPTLPRPSWDASTVLRLPRCLHTLKHSLLYWVPNLPRGSNYVLIYYLRSIRRQT